MNYDLDFNNDPVIVEKLDEILDALNTLISMQESRLSVESSAASSLPEPPKRRSWTEQENEIFLKAIMKYGLNKHIEIAHELPNREAANVSSHLEKMEKRWHNALYQNVIFNAEVKNLKLPDTIPINIFTNGVAHIRNLVKTQIFVVSDACSEEVRDLINNRIISDEKHDNEMIKIIASDVALAKIGDFEYELGAEEEGLKNAKLWSKHDAKFNNRIQELAHMCTLGNDYEFYVWYVAQDNNLSTGILCADLVCGIISSLEK